MAIAAEHGKLIFRKTERELLRLSSGQKSDNQRAEAVHSYRTTVRRLQTLLQQLVPAHDRNQKKLLKMLNRIRKSAGKVRDIDVQLSALRSLKTAQEPRRKTQLTQSLLELRAQHERSLDKLLKKGEIRDLRKRLKRAARNAHLDGKCDPLSVARQTLAAVKLPDGPADEATLHRYRIAVKRARYAAEFAPASPDAANFIRQLKRLQDALGHWHDWLTLTHTAVDRLGDVNESSLVAALHNVTRGKFRQALAAVSEIQAKSAISTVQPRRARKSSAKNPVRSQQTGAAA